MHRVAAVTEIDASPDAVWAELADIASHDEWMADAASIEFIGEQRSGVGTRFGVYTRVGPFHVDDEMVIVEWDEPARMTVEHTGSVTGRGGFTVEPLDFGRRTRLTWIEHLSFPWYFGSRLGGVVIAPILSAVWRSNLRQLRKRLEAG